MFGTIGWPEIILILVVILLIFGARKLPDAGKALGKGIREFKKALKGIEEDIEEPEEKREESKSAETRKKKGKSK